MKKPKIRFKGFTDDWEQCKLRDVGTTYTGLSGKTKEDFGHGNGKFVTYMNVFSNPVCLPDITEPVEIDDSQNKVIFGDVLFTTSSETPEEVGMSSVWLGNAENTYLNSFCFGYRPTVEFNPYYLAYMLRSSSMRKKITFLAQGISRYNISKNKMMDIEIPIPNIEEQKQIGSYFRSLDHLITLHQRECEQLKTFKKYMLQNMFPENGEKVPKIRFKGFTDDWEQRKFGDVAEIRRGLTYKPDDVKESGIRVLRSSNINEGYFETYKDDILVDEVAVNIPYVKNGDIIITSANGSSRLVGKHAIIKNIPDNSMVHGGFMLVASTNQPEFLNSSMNSPWYAKFINTYVVGGNGAIGNLSKSDLDNQEITVPSLEEQKEIGQYFSTLDKLVTLHQRKCEQLKKFKKYMLQNMFI